jgi:hypothetical protein
MEGFCFENLVGFCEGPTIIASFYSSTERDHPKCLFDHAIRWLSANGVL